NDTRIAVEDDSFRARQSEKALALGAADQRQPSLTREIDAPGGEARAGYQNRNPHLHGLDDHLRRQAAGRIEDLSRCGHLVEMHVTGDLVDRVVPPDILHINERPVLLAQDAAMDGPGGEV